MYLSKGFFHLRALARQIWIRIALISALALVTAAVAPLISPIVPDGLKDRIDDEAVKELLGTLTGTMLAVATFSLAVMVSAHHYAASQVTPRSHRLLRQDGRTQGVLSTFIGAFVFALASIAIIDAGFYAWDDYVVVFGATILVLVLVVVALVRWVQQLSRLGSLESTTERVETVARDALAARMDAPRMGAAPLDRDAVPASAVAARAERFGFVGHVDMEALAERAEAADAVVHVAVLPGDWVTTGDPLLWIEAERLSPATQDAMADLVVIGSKRSFDQDPLFGIQVMSEVAQRALSPGINDPRTAIDVVLRQGGILDGWRAEAAEGEVRFPRLRARSMDSRALVEEAVDHIARDGAALVEVQMAVQAVLTRLARSPSPGMRAAAQAVSARALARSDEALDLDEDRARVHAAAPGAGAAGAERPLYTAASR